MTAKDVVLNEGVANVLDEATKSVDHLDLVFKYDTKSALKAGAAWAAGSVGLAGFVYLGYVAFEKTSDRRAERKQKRAEKKAAKKALKLVENNEEDNNTNDVEE